MDDESDNYSEVGRRAADELGGLGGIDFESMMSAEWLLLL